MDSNRIEYKGEIRLKMAVLGFLEFLGRTQKITKIPVLVRPNFMKICRCLDRSKIDHHTKFELVLTNKNL